MKKIIIAGANGFLGSHLCTYFANKNYEVIGLVRNPIQNQKNITYHIWDGKTLGKWRDELNGAFAVINLAGRSVDCRYTEKNKAEILNSRLDSTKVLGKAIESCDIQPNYWLNAASATIYRHSEDKPMTESNGEIGTGFSVEVCQKWENLFFSYDQLKTKLIGLRLSIVLGDGGGVMIPFKRLVQFGLGGKMGSGQQMFSWINITDMIRAIEFILTKDNPSKIYNLAHPQPITNSELMRKLRKKFGMPFGFPNPIWALELGAILIGTETELIVKSRFVIPENLMNQGFKFEVNDI
jgi:uncharacterized protein (TIGR01777 family)